MKFICSLIVVDDVQRARFFYEEILGQKVKADYGENVTFHGDFSIHQRDHFQKLINGLPVRRKSNNFELFFEEDDLEPVVSKLEQHQVEFIHGIVEQPWKQRVVRFYDDDKNIIEIGERLEHTAFRLSRQNFSLEEIARITYLSVDDVIHAIQEYSNDRF
ncbi:MAG: VOC family protein [Anaerolineales bacterium]|nr:VOC family protein [Anaerolineales bacterium]